MPQPLGTISYTSMPAAGRSSHLETGVQGQFSILPPLVSIVPLLLAVVAGQEEEQ
jgi:hypothetical protein